MYWPEESCFPHLNTESAIKFTDGSSSDPFFLHVSYFHPHPPYMAPSRYAAPYNSGDTALADHANPAALSTRLDRFARAMGFHTLEREGLTETMRHYYAQVEWGVDEPAGQFLRALEERGLAEGTVVVLTSDHGDFTGEYGMVRKGMFLYDALLRVLLLWWAPGRIVSGVQTDALALSADIFPTRTELTGARDPPGASGVSLAARLLQGDSGRARILTSAAYGDLAPSDEGQAPRHSRALRPTVRPMHRTKMVRIREWEFILNETEPPELYRIADDRQKERRNLAGSAEYASKCRHLEARLAAWWAW